MKREIICLSTSPWYPIPTRKQQVMSRVQDAEILYFDPAITWLAPLKDKLARKKVGEHKLPGEKVQENLTVHRLPVVLPFFAKFRFINRINQKKVGKFVEKIAKAHGFTNPILWVYSPVSADVTPYITHEKLVYDCVDRHSAYGGLMNPALVDEMELDLAAQSDQVFATAVGLCKRLQAVNPKACFIPNGANYERFAQAALPQEKPAAMANIPGKILGFVGALQECIAYDHLIEAATKRPDWSFVFIGRKSVGVDLSALEALPNVHFLGLIPNEELPKYMAHFDLCLNLFANNDLSQDVSPLKFFEYLATGKPIVSTPQPLQVLDYRDAIHIAPTLQDFIPACEAALADTSEERKAQRMQLGRDSSWDARVAEMERILGNA